MNHEPPFQPEDTRPGPAFDAPPGPLPTGLQYGVPFRGDDSVGGGLGCGMYGLIGGVLLLFSLAIVALAAAAGWTSGQREANIILTSTQDAAIAEQLNRIPADIANGNLVLLDTRIRFLATLTPGVPIVAELQQTATALYLTSQPTATPSPSPTPTPTPTAQDMEPTPDLIIPTSPGGYDLASLLQQAQTAVDTAQWQDAIDLLDVIMGLDPLYESARVAALMRRALNSYALQLYNAGQPAAANVIAGRAEELGLLDGSIQYERYMAELYLSARAGVSLGDPRAQAALQEILSQGRGGRYYAEAQQLLYDQYVRLGDAQVAIGEYCPAANYYRSAVNIFSSGVATGKLSMANTICAQATPTIDPFSPFAPSDGTPIPGFAPIGVPGT
jgi:hypothetical protein